MALTPAAASPSKTCPPCGHCPGSRTGSHDGLAQFQPWDCLGQACWETPDPGMLGCGSLLRQLRLEFLSVSFFQFSLSLPISLHFCHCFFACLFVCFWTRSYVAQAFSECVYITTAGQYTWPLHLATAPGHYTWLSHPQSLSTQTNLTVSCGRGRRIAMCS